MTLYYCPLEPYKERYTEQWSAPKTGWLERNWIKAYIPYFRVEGNRVIQSQRPMQKGVVLDGVRRCRYAMSQVDELLCLIEDEKITDQDDIYFDDFWHPGIESLPYCFDILDVHPNMYAFLHAQSIDQYDFTYSMRGWMRHFERGIQRSLKGIFTSCPTLANLIVNKIGGSLETNVHVTGHPFCSEEVKERMPPNFDLEMNRENKVVWSSRWDKEKNPDFFMDVAEDILNGGSGVTFVVCTGAKNLRSNDFNLIARARELQRDFPKYFLVKENLTKEEYYKELCTAKIQFNCADQDFVAITLLEASVAGCFPVYPRFRSFPETFCGISRYMYTHKNHEEAVFKILSILERDDLWTLKELKKREWIHKRFDTTWERQLKIMKFHRAPKWRREDYIIDSPFANYGYE